MANSATALSTYNDLLWAIQSPVLCGSPPPLFERWAGQAPSAEPISPDTISKELCEQRRIPIGRYFEALIHAWLETRQEVTKLAANVPIRNGGTTVGEADLLFEAGGKCYHWELAIKFYLGTGSRLATRDWFGPQGRDRLDLKLAKLSEQQLQLMDRPEAKVTLAEHGLTNVESHALIKGYLFHPFAQWECGDCLAPPSVNRGHAKGWWVHQSDAASVIGRGEHWRCLAKPEWLAPARGPVTLQGAELRSWLNDCFERNDRPLMLAALDSAGNELERGFVVPDNWSPSPR